MEPSKEAIAVRLTRLNRLILGKVTSVGSSSFNKRTVERESLLDALTVLYEECNDDPVKKSDEFVRIFVDKYRSTLAELRRTRVCIADFDMLQVIGSGHFGDVHMVREKQTGDVYAMKTLRKETTVRRSISAAEIERDVLAVGAGAWIPRLQYAFQDTNNLYLVMELCSGGDLAGLLSRRNHPLSERDAAFYVAEITHALAALHNLGFVHRDIKPHNILLDRCGHVKLGDFGSSARLSEGSSTLPAGATADYLAPELLAAADCAARHTVCLDCCRGIQPTPITACDYWSLGVVAYELVTLKRPFSKDDDDSIALILSNIQRYEREAEQADTEAEVSWFESGVSAEWRALVAGLLRVRASRRFHYLDTLQHPALRHLTPHHIRDQAPPWVPALRGPEDATHFTPPPRAPPPVLSAPFRTRAPFAGQLPFVGFSFVAPDETEETLSSGFNASHDCTAIDLATYKSAEKLSIMRGREIASLQSKLAAAEAEVGEAAERARRTAEDEAERTRARLQAEITALSLQNRRLERQIEVEKEERMALERTNQELQSSLRERSSAELRKAQVQISQLEGERDSLKEDVRRLENRVGEMRAECDRALAAADATHKHYKDSVAKERALRRQTMSGCEADTREMASKLAAAEANAAKEVRARNDVEKQLTTVEAANRNLEIELGETKRELEKVQEWYNEKKRLCEDSNEELKKAQHQLTQERVRSSTLNVQVQELQRTLEEKSKRETALEEQCSRTEARLQQRLEDAEIRATEALKEDARHREKVNKLEQLVRQLEREVSALEARGIEVAAKKEVVSDTESVCDDGDKAAQAQILVLKEQIERAEAQLQSRAEEIASLRQEARTANLARWRKEREYNELSTEAKASARELKRLEEKLTTVTEARKSAEQKCMAFKTELDSLKPQLETTSKQLESTKERYEKLKKSHDVLEAEVDRSRNDIRKLKSELQYSEKRRIRAEEQEELGSRERAQLRDEAHDLKNTVQQLEQNNKALQEACSLLEEQLTDLERLADMHELKSNDLEGECSRLREDVSSIRARLQEAERVAEERGAGAALAAQRHEEAREQARLAHNQMQLLKERAEARGARVHELESAVAALEAERAALQAALSGAARRLRALQEEAATLRTRAHHHHAHALRLQAQLNDAQEEIAAQREAADAAAAWWRTRETKADATLRQQAKLIDFLQAKVEEANRKKCSLSNKLFGRSGRRNSAASPPLRRANRELREEVERLRSKLALLKNDNESCSIPATPTPRTPRTSTKINGFASTEACTPDADDFDTSFQLIWKDEKRERAVGRAVCGRLQLRAAGRRLAASLLSTQANALPKNEAPRAFTVKMETGGEATIVCSSQETRSRLLAALQSPPSPPTSIKMDAITSAGYAAKELMRMTHAPLCALYFAHDVVAIGSTIGLHSLRGAVQLEGTEGEVRALAMCGGRVVASVGEAALHGPLAALSSALRRAGALCPALQLARVKLPDTTSPSLLQPLTGHGDTEGSCLAIACGRRVFLLRYEAAATEFRITRSLTVDRSPDGLLLTDRALFITGEKPLKVNLPAGPLESFGMDDLTILAAAKKRTPPKAIILIKQHPTELLICYTECGVFVDDKGKRTRTEDAKWEIAVNNWVFVQPFLYLIGNDVISIIYIADETYKTPPCTCDTQSIASTPSEYTPTKYNLKLNDVKYLGTAQDGIIVRSIVEDEYCVSLVEGMVALRSVGASVESLDTISDTKGSTTDLANSATDTPQDTSRDDSQESIEPNTGFLADIRKRAQQMRKKQKPSKPHQTPDDVIKAILTTEVGVKRSSPGRMSPATISDTSESDYGENVHKKGPNDLCAEMFTRQVRFQ